MASDLSRFQASSLARGRNSTAFVTLRGFLPTQATSGGHARATTPSTQAHATRSDLVLPGTNKPVLHDAPKAPCPDGLNPRSMEWSKAPGSVNPIAVAAIRPSDTPSLERASEPPNSSPSRRHSARALKTTTKPARQEASNHPTRSFRRARLLRNLSAAKSRPCHVKRRKKTTPRVGSLP